MIFRVVININVYVTAAILLMYYHGDLNSGRTQSCGCIRSKGNQLILKELQKSDYIFDKEYKINYNDKIYFFDFVIFNKDNRIKCFIEFDGQQHYKY